MSDYTHLAKLLLLWGLTLYNILKEIHSVLRKQETFTIHPLSIRYEFIFSLCNIHFDSILFVKSCCAHAGVMGVNKSGVLLSSWTRDS